MTTEPENKDKAEQKVSRGELSEKELEKVTGGGSNTTKKTTTTSTSKPTESVSLNFTEIEI
jgi:bacteriocin-like protein